MDSDELQVHTGIDPDDGFVIEVEGYLDDSGGDELTRQAAAALSAGHNCVRIDLEHVVLFNCSGARRLLAALHELQEQGLHVELVHVRPPLRRVLEFSA
jgi:anti-anti-sigma factor